MATARQLAQKKTNTELQTKLTETSQNGEMKKADAVRNLLKKRKIKKPLNTGLNTLTTT